MCVAFFTLDHPDYALILCTNRDEYLARPTAPARFHQTFGGVGIDGGDASGSEQPDILSGIDVQAGGTWLGLTRLGRLALLTNITEPDGIYAYSRGRLLTSFLTSPPSPSLEDQVQKLIPHDARYAGFNLLLLAPASVPDSPPLQLSFDAVYVTNHGGGGPIVHRTLTQDQRHRWCLSNGIDNAGADQWPKVQHGIHLFDDLLSSIAPSTSEDALIERLFHLLTWRPSQPPRDRSELRNTIEVEPVHLAHGLNGTRLSTVVLVKRNGEVIFTEQDRWTLSDQGQPILADPSSQRAFRFQLV